MAVNHVLMRQYPIIQNGLPTPRRPISFVCVRFCDEFDHNISKSECVHNPANEFIVVENTQNLFFQTLGQAVNHGIAEAKHDLICVVHEDVLLLPSWQSMLEQSLDLLERHDPNWGLAGAVGWIDEGSLIGHWSDPHDCVDTLQGKPFVEIVRPDEQLMLFRRSCGVALDSNLPSIHNIGLDLATTAAMANRKTYAINAPTIHKYADESGGLIQSAQDSPKIRDRGSLTYEADKACSDEYLARKWSVEPRVSNQSVPKPDVEQKPSIDSPYILLGRGGGGTRLLSTMAQDTGLFIGNNVNVSGDCMEMVGAIYRAILRKHQCPDTWHKSLIVDDLRTSASNMLRAADHPAKWGFKLPESLLILPELREAFPDAKYVFFGRDPAGTTLRRSHMTARTDNHIGRASLVAAYDFFDKPRMSILSDDPLTRMAITTVHQLALADRFRATLEKHNWLDLDFDDTLSDPMRELRKLSRFCDLSIKTSAIADTVDLPRSGGAKDQIPVAKAAEITDLIAKLYERARQISGE